MYPLDDSEHGFAAFNATDSTFYPISVDAGQQQAAQQLQHQPVYSPQLIQQAQAAQQVQQQQQNQHHQAAAAAVAPVTATATATVPVTVPVTVPATVPVPVQYVQYQQQPDTPIPAAYANGSSNHAASTPATYRTRQQQQQQQVVVATYPQVEHAPTLLSQMWARRRDLLKLVVLSLVVLFAISSHWSVSHYVKLYLEQLPYSQSVWIEAAVRAGYPAAVLLLTWVLKTVR